MTRGAVRERGVAVTRGSGRVLPFVAVGAAGFLVQLVTLALLSKAGLHYLVATGVAVEAAILNNFVLHTRWTWRDRTRYGSVWARAARFNALSAAASLVGNLAIVGWLVPLGVPVVLANIAAVVAMSAVNYMGLDRWVFVRRGTLSPEQGLEPAKAANRPRYGDRAVVTMLCALALACPTVSAGAAELTSETKQAWRAYVSEVEARVGRELSQAERFLALDFDPPADRRTALAAARNGEVVVRNIAGGGHEGEGVEVPSGTVHHWRGVVFVPGATVQDVLAAVADPTGTRAHRQEDVLEARVLARSPHALRLFLKLQRRVIVSATYNTEHDVTYRTHGAGRASSRSIATRIAEVVNVGQPDEHERPVGVDRGFLWGLNSYWRYQSVPGGVLVELESVTLSRAVPWGVGAVVRPLVDRVARESLTRTLVALRTRFAPSSQAG